ncbi:4-carboxymuconolactone decarboxylase [Rhodococcus opacus PD630]|uniref:carboxymuconolactone decarboxylase family protein n=1 Tax=Rhodococcus opacus TaxID=37919 RepID=UPI00029CC0EC|nr:carboxymuconolactone decarboxylase family protein [Rhodococcus opacus]KXF54911.1 4-carboxymuconolactone decarboxylase [Rhodococcus sp. SC4]RZI53724.1 MAG: carboxymuconolactone decarboxylase family protein [Pseudonocardia sp.]AHK31700.1 4-carboxymuconolactone decarboxylase [Rhodococcus opacus PD630]EHI45014.1 4-carboxymuconolactone decarboxylase [Rhodococcus opacus PD630]UDG94227.1 carboxymuconolactone decarboxylase family protein [Rhodococcus opacus PD630]
MSEKDKRPSGDRHPLGRFAPGLIGFTDDVLFGQVWERAVISAKERSMITVACLVTGGNVEQLRYHLVRARDNGATRIELVEVITHLAFYAGWPKAMAAMAVAQEVLGSEED